VAIIYKTDIEMSNIGIYIHPYNGNIGIGTTNALSKLHIQGDLITTNTLILYLLATPIIHEWQYTGNVTPITKVTYNFGTNTYAKAVLADIYVGGSSISDHQSFTLGKNHSAVQNWTEGINVQPSTVFGNHQRQVITLMCSGQTDSFSSYYGVWYSSKSIPIENNGQLFFSCNGNSGSSGWIYVVTRGYYL
jgi:hypothetical protein